MNAKSETIERTLIQWIIVRLDPGVRTQPVSINETQYFGKKVLGF